MKWPEHWNGVQIRVDENNYVNAHDICRANGKRWFDYLHDEEWASYSRDEFFDAVAESKGLPVDQMIVQGTRGILWVHDSIATDLAQWANRKFHFWVIHQIAAGIAGDQVDGNPPWDE